MTLPMPRRRPPIKPLPKNPTEEQACRFVAQKIARIIFELGDEPDNLTYRLEYKVKDPKDPVGGERGAGGLVEPALVDLFTRILMGRRT